MGWSPARNDPTLEIPPSEMWILMRIQHKDGSPLPTQMVVKRQIIAFSKQYFGEQPHDVKKVGTNQNILHI